MSIHVIKVPDVGEGVAEVELVSWSVDPGDRVTRNQMLAEVMTDKANVEIPSPVDGTVTRLHGDVGGTLAVGTTLIELTLDVAAAGPTSTPAPLPSPTSTAAPRVDPPARVSAPIAVHTPVVDREPGERPRATPAVRHRAREAGIDLDQVVGTGPAGRISHDDLDAHLDRGPTPAAVGGSLASGPRSGPARAIDTSVLDQPIVGVRRRIAENTLASTQSIPHITYVEEVDVTALEELRATLNDERPETAPRLTLLPFLIRALTNELPAFPSMNAHVDDEAGVLRQFGGVHVGIATQTPSGLMVPVVRHAEGETVWSLAERIHLLAEAARNGTAKRDELSGSTITITSLGPLGGIVTTPVINKPEVAIVGVNKIAVRPVWVDGEFVPRKIMNLSSSFDHRVIDGWDAATFVQALRRSLEQPALLFIDRP